MYGVRVKVCNDKQCLPIVRFADKSVLPVAIVPIFIAIVSVLQIVKSAIGDGRLFFAKVEYFIIIVVEGSLVSCKFVSGVG